MKFEKFLLPFDGSVHSISATNYALNLAKEFGAHVTIINCYEWHSGMPEVQDLMVETLSPNLRRAARDILKKAGKIFENQGVEYKLEIIDGSPGQVLAELAKSKEYDLIIMGSHGHSEIEGLFLGSVTHKVLNTIYCPVLVVP